MNSFISFQHYLGSLILQIGPPPPGDGGNTQIDSVSIDQYIGVGIIIAILIAGYFLMKQNRTKKKYSRKKIYK